MISKLVFIEDSNNFESLKTLLEEIGVHYNLEVGCNSWKNPVLVSFKTSNLGFCNAILNILEAMYTIRRVY